MAKRVRLVVGPPCAGKTTWAREHAGPDTVVVDFDDYARIAGSTARWNHAARYRDEAEAMVLDAMARVVEATEGDYIVIRVAADPTQRQELADWLDAEVIVLEPPYEVLIERAAQRTGPKARSGIDYWFRLNG